MGWNKCDKNVKFPQVWGLEIKKKEKKKQKQHF
jgi:hypothetical protein